MIRPAHLALLGRARRFAADKPELLARFPAEGGEVGLTTAAVHRVVDFAVMYGFNDIARPILSARTRASLEAVQEALTIGPHAFATELRRVGVKDARLMGGRQLLDLLGGLERRHRLDVPTFYAVRGRITPRQVALVHTARQQAGWPDERFYASIQLLGGVNSTFDLDARGLELTLAHAEIDGFKREPEASAKDAALGGRPGFASPDQLGLIRQLWREWSGADDESALASWLERYHRTSALRFLTAAAAGKVVTALKAMKGRKRDTAA